MAKKEITLIAVVDNARLDKDTVQYEIIGTLGFNPEIEYRVNEYGANVTEILPLTVAEAENVLEWCAENGYDVSFELER